MCENFRTGLTQERERARADQRGQYRGKANAAVPDRARIINPRFHAAFRFLPPLSHQWFDARSVIQNFSGRDA